MQRFRLGRAVLTPKGARWHAGGHPWVFADDVAELDPGAGLVVEVLEPRGRRLGLATLSPRSRIALRFLVRGADARLDDRAAFLRGRIAAAIARRAPLAAETDAVRLVSAEADGLPGLVVDRYADVVVLQGLTAFVEEHMDHVVPALVELCAPAMVLARNDARVRRLEGLPQVVELCHGRRVPRVRVREHGLELEVDPWRGQKTGAFLDQRPARRLAEGLARDGAEVLDLCCYTGGFSLHAARAGARVLAVDQSREALEECAAAAERNGLAGIETRRANAFDVVKELVVAGRRFDGIVLDPPAFAKSRREVEGALRGYLDLNSRALRLLRPGGWLLTCSCSYNVTPELFLGLLRGAAARAGVEVLDRGRLAPALDHPVLLGLPESDYLKVHHLEVRGADAP